MSIIGTFPIIINNGDLEDATVVMRLFAFIQSQVNGAPLAASGANSDITSLSGLSTPLSVAQGGTGSATLPPGRLINIQTFAATGVYTPTTGTTRVLVEAVGGGGGGGGAAATGAGQVSIGSGGSSGSYAKGYFTSAFTGVTVTIGALGPGGVGVAGTNGGTTSFGALMSCPGGTYGSSAGPANPPFGVTGTFAPSTSTGGNIINGSGVPGGAATSAVGAVVAGIGSSSPFGGGGTVNIGGANGVNATGYGSGGSGAYQSPSAGVLAGGSGSPGICIVYEYA